ncbi:MAG: tripartite tricarboxylate transporter substrate-binding protein [Planctomycetota bacterium]
MKIAAWIIILVLLIWRFGFQPDYGNQDGFPNQKIELVVPYQAGGGTDNFARILQKTLDARDEIKVPLVIINQDGGSGTIGSRMIKDAEPDGYQLLCHHEALIATKLAGVVDYGPEAFRPIAQVASVVLLMIVREDSPYQSLPGLLKAAQENPNSIRVGANQGSPAYFICKQLMNEYPGAKFNFISAGGAKRYTFLLGGKLEAGIFSLAEYVAFRKQNVPASENILAIANFGKSRHPRISDVKTSREQGLETSAENA